LSICNAIKIITAKIDRMTNNPDRVYFDKLRGILSDIDFGRI